MKNNKELKKHTAAIRISNEIGLIPRKIWNVLLLNAYDDLKKQRRYEIPITVLCDVIEYKGKNYDHLRKSLEKLTGTAVSWDIGGGSLINGAWSKDFISCSLLSGAQLKEGVLSYEYYSGLAEWLYKPAIYQKINITQQNLFKTSYGLALWENCLRYINVGSTGFADVDVWRELLGATAKSYKAFYRFNDRVLKPAIKEVNTISNIQITLKTKKRGREVIQIGFDVKETKKKELISENRLRELESSSEYQELISYKIHKVKALTWIEKYGVEYIRNKLDFVKQQQQMGKIKSSASGFLRRAIEDDYLSESDIQKKLENERKRKQQAAEHQRKLEQQRKKLEATFIKQAKQEYISSLSDNDKEALLEEARKAYADSPVILKMIKDINSPIVEGYLTPKIPNLETRKEAYIKENLKM